MLLCSLANLLILGSIDGTKKIHKRKIKKSYLHNSRTHTTNFEKYFYFHKIRAHIIGNKMRVIRGHLTANVLYALKCSKNLIKMH